MKPNWGLSHRPVGSYHNIDRKFPVFPKNTELIVTGVLTLSLLAANFEDRGDLCKQFWSRSTNFDPQNMSPHLSSKLFDTQIKWSRTDFGWKQCFFAIFQRKRREKIITKSLLLARHGQNCDEPCKWIGSRWDAEERTLFDTETVLVPING